MATADAPALSLNWTFGSSTNVAHNVLNLSDGYNERVCYVAAHTAIIFDKKTRKQVFLQGHANAISCMAATEDRSTLITADVGNESMMVLWNSATGSPTKILKQPHAHGVLAMDVSPGGAWLATIGAPGPETGEQEIALWAMQALLTDAAPKPAVLTVIPAGDVQLALRFNMNNTQELISNGRRRVYFWSSQYPSSGRFKYYSPPLRSKDFKQSVGDFVMSVFVPGSTQALTATQDGDVVVWDEQGITAQMGTRATDRRAVKLMRIHQQAVSYLGTIGDYIVSGGRDGFVRFYDPLLRIVAWFEDLEAGPVTGLSFSLAMPAKANAPELADTLNRFMVPDFMVCTAQGKLVSVNSASFEEYDVQRRKGVSILEPMLTDVASISCHPTQPEFAVLGSSGTLQRWDMLHHTPLAARTFSKAPGAHVAYSRDGSFLVVGFQSGYVYILNVSDLSDIHATRNTPHNVIALATATTGRHVAVADDAHQVLLYAYLPYKHIMRWDYVGKARAHHAPVVGLVFGESPSGHTRLFSLGQDRRLVEYTLGASTPAAGLVIGSHQDLTSTNTPTALSFAPPLQYFKHHSARTLLLIAEDSYRIKMYDPDLQAYVATFVGPTFGGPMQQLLMFKSVRSEGAFLAYSCGERVVGLVAWPMDGDPAKSLGLVAHPGAVTCTAISHNGRKLVTAGSDGILNMWDVNTRVLEAQVARLAGPDRWAAVLDNPGLLQDMRAYFTYAQVKAQGEDSMLPRDVSGLVPVHMVPDLMCAAGYYPSQAEVKELQDAITFIAQSRDQESLTHIDFATFLQLYVNFRPLFDVSQDDLAAAFKALGAHPNHGRLQREALLSQLQQLGEPMTADEVVGSLMALTGAPRVAESMPHALDAATFAADVLGFERPTAEVS